ncbi:tetratricopeptide repeat protein [Jiella pelagia]|uniref:Ancillary SecYEG translocon subunit n=1 Tax=Jiella pelagia TaxID=2986949 RepID=A0ABY7C0R2_9HYPH|nr:tetratricopeptide repeat protein [Jiella pelagia]WAP69257.1 tetratricopeptide repeat protein [Jiella pelagia]
MSDDSFFREVDEELRQDKVKAVWTRFGAWLLGGAIAVIAITVGVVAYEHYETNQANAAGDRYAAAMRLADEGNADAAIQALQEIAGNGVGAYPALARLSIGGLEAKAGRPEQAVAAYDAVSNDADAPGGLRDMAAIRAAYVLVDSGSLDDVRQRVERLSGDSDPLRFPAREAIALAAWKAGDAETAKPFFQGLVDDSGTPSDISGRARILLDLINAGATGPNALTPAEGAETQSPASADNGLGAVDLPGLLDGGAATGEAGAGGAVMPTTDLGQSGGPEAPAEPRADEAAPAGPQAGDVPQAGDASAPAAPGAGASGAAPADGAASQTGTAPAEPDAEDQSLPAGTISPAPSAADPPEAGAGGGSSVPSDEASPEAGTSPEAPADAASGTAVQPASPADTNSN